MNSKRHFATLTFATLRPSARLAACLTLGCLLAGGAAQAADGTWTNTAAGSWTNSVNWLDGAIPNGVGDSATINADITAARTITIHTNALFPDGVTLGTLTVGDSGSSYFAYTITNGPGGRIIFDASAGDAVLNYPETSSAVNNIIGAPITLNDNLAVNVNSAWSGANAIFGVIADGANSYSITFNGTGPTPGTVELRSPTGNSYDGGTFIIRGRIRARDHAGAFGTGMVTISDGGQAYCSNGGNMTNAFTIAGLGATDSGDPIGVIRLQSGTEISGPIALAAKARIAAQNNTGTISGPFSGGYELELANTGNGATTLTCSSPANSTEATRLNQINASGTRTVIATTRNALSQGPLYLDGNSTLRLNGNDLAFAHVTNAISTATIGNYSGSAAATVSLGSDNSSFSYSGTLVDGTGGQALNLTKVGSGTMTLSGNNPYTGSTTISNGTLALDATGSIADSASINVVAGALLDISSGYSFSLGTGRVLNAGRTSSPALDVNGPLTSGGILQPAGGGVAGTMTLAGGLTLIGGSLNFDLSTTNGANDRIVTSGALNLSGTITLNVTWPGGIPGLGTYTLIVADSLAAGGAGNFLLGTGLNVGGYVFSLDATTTPGTVYLNVAATGRPAASLTWKGNNASNPTYWDVNTTTNWLNGVNADAFFDGDSVTFDDTASAGAVDVVTTVKPAAVIVSNSATAYAIGGWGDIAVASSFTKTGSGTVTLNPFTGFSFSAPVSINGGTVSVLAVADSGIASPLGAGTSVAFDGGTLEYTGPGGSMNRDLTLNSSGGKVRTDTSLTLSGTVAGVGALTKAGTGLLEITGTTTGVTAATYVEGGILRLGGANALSNSTIYLGTASSGSSTVTLQTTPSAFNEYAPIVVGSGAPVGTSLFLDNNPGNTSLARIFGTITLANHDLWITNSASGGIMQIDGQITGTGNLVLDNVTNARRSRFINTANDFTGDVYLRSGGLQLGNGSPTSTTDVIPDNSDIHLSAGTILALGCDGVTMGGLVGGAATVDVPTEAMVTVNVSSGTSTYTLTIGANNRNATYDGVLADYVGSVNTRPLAITKIGTGSQIFNGICTNTGPTYLGGGALFVNSSFSSPITVSNSATLAGTGVLGGNVTVLAGGSLSPGASIGVLTLSGTTLGLNPDSATIMEINAGNSTGDLVTGIGTLNYGGTLTVTNVADTLAAGQAFQLFSASSYNNDFAAMQLPALGPGLAWRWTATNGTLAVVAGLATSPTNIVVGVSGNQLTLSWPQDYIGWTLQSQTNSLATGITSSWYPVAGSATTNQVTFTIDPANPTVFFRLKYP